MLIRCHQTQIIQGSICPPIIKQWTFCAAMTNRLCSLSLEEDEVKNRWKHMMMMKWWRSLHDLNVDKLKQCVLRHCVCVYFVIICVIAPTLLLFNVLFVDSASAPFCFKPWLISVVLLTEQRYRWLAEKNTCTCCLPAKMLTDCNNYWAAFHFSPRCKMWLSS